MHEFDKYFEKEENINNIFKDYKDIFEKLDDLRSQFLGNILTTDEDLNNALKFYTGAIQTLQPLFQVSQAYKESKEDGEGLRLRCKAIEDKIKITDATAKSTAHYFVRNYIKVRNLLNAYVISCDKGITTCQTLLKYKHKEELRPQE